MTENIVKKSLYSLDANIFCGTAQLTDNNLNFSLLSSYVNVVIIFGVYSYRQNTNIREI